MFVLMNLVFNAIVIPMIINPEVSYRMFQKLSKL